MDPVLHPRFHRRASPLAHGALAPGLRVAVAIRRLTPRVAQVSARRLSVHLVPGLQVGARVQVALLIFILEMISSIGLLYPIGSGGDHARR